MAIELETVERVRLLVGESAGVEFGFQETSIGKVGDIDKRTTVSEDLVIPQEIVELNVVSGAGDIWMRYRESSLDKSYPGIDIEGVNQLQLTVFPNDACNAAPVSLILDRVPGLRYEGTSTAIRDIFSANKNSVLYCEIEYSLV